MQFIIIDSNTNEKSYGTKDLLLFWVFFSEFYELIAINAVFLLKWQVFEH